jgi:hypothetical protein
MECGCGSCRFSSGMRSLPVLDGEINFAWEKLKLSHQHSKIESKI